MLYFGIGQNILADFQYNSTHLKSLTPHVSVLETNKVFLLSNFTHYAGMCLTYFFTLSIARCLITVLVYHLGSSAA